MATKSYNLYHVFIFISSILLLIQPSTQLQSTQSWSLLRIKQLLNSPSVLNTWHEYTDFCYGLQSTPNANVVCYQDSVSQLHIIGSSGTSPLPKTFSIDSFVTTLTRLPDLKVLTLVNLGLWGPLPVKISRLSNLEILNMSSNYFFGAIPHEISRMSNLQTLILDHNMFSGEVPNWLNELPLLAVLSLKNNTFEGNLPNSIGEIASLRTLVLSSNNLSGDVPDLTNLKNLQVLDLENNSFGPQFPKIGKRIISIILKQNKFTGGLPPELDSFYLLQNLDISLNRFVGPFMPSLLSLSSIRYLNIKGNKFTGKLSKNMSCNENLEYVDVSSNLLSGTLPTCLNSNSKSGFYSYNCFNNMHDHTQHPMVFCQNQALAVGIPVKKETSRKNKIGVAIGVAFGVVFGVLVLGVLGFFIVKRENERRASRRSPRRLVEHASSAYPSKLLANARYISQTVKLGALGIAPYRSFSLVELEAATNNFENASLMGEGSWGQMYKGRLSSGTLVTIRCVKVKKSQTTQSFNRHIETISKLRHRHLVSALGHCFEYDLEDSTITQLYLIFEYVPNGDLRINISKGVEGQKLSWSQRISAAIGVAKGIQFLHGGIIPGLFSNNLKITNILLDQNLVAKIGRYNLPILSENIKTEVGSGGHLTASKESSEGVEHGEKIDIYDFGAILLEIICGRPITSKYDVEIMKTRVQSAVASDMAARRKAIADLNLTTPNICSDESLKTVMEICLRCLSKDPIRRPSIEDVLWNLQFSAQVQDDCKGDENSTSSEESPFSNSIAPRNSN